jgi:aconitate decarboxylase
VRFRDGTELEAARAASRAVQQPQSNAEIVEKFRTLTDGLITKERQAAIERAVAGLEGLADIDTLTRLLAPPVEAPF